MLYYTPEVQVVHRLPPCQEGQHLLGHLVHLLVQVGPCLLALPSLHRVPVVQGGLYHQVHRLGLVDLEVLDLHLDQLLPISILYYVQLR